MRAHRSLPRGDSSLTLVLQPLRHAHENRVELVFELTCLTNLRAEFLRLQNVSQLKESNDFISFFKGARVPKSSNLAVCFRTSFRKLARFNKVPNIHLL